MKIDVIVPSPAHRWQEEIVNRLAAAGHDVGIFLARASAWPVSARLALALERRVLRRDQNLDVPVALAERRRESSSKADLTVDLTGISSAPLPAMRVAFDGSFDEASVPSALAAGRLPDVEIVLDGRGFDRAAPMVDNRVFPAAGTDDILARAVTLTLRAIARFAGGSRDTTRFLPRERQGAFVPPYLLSTVPGIVREVMRRRTYHFAHWRVGYRLHDRPGVAETGKLGNGWAVLPDDGTRFYADPFPFEHDGQRYIFVEDYPHATKKAVISVSTLGPDGVARAPVPVLEEPHHLSYPQVFADGGEVWMLPEASASRKLTLYRAERFPNSWLPAVTLLEGEISDATLLEHDGRFWLFATDRDGGGSTSDTLVVYHARSLTGPWQPHKANPIVIDRRRARPGGAVARVGGKLLLPTQDGTEGYGAGLGLSEIVRLDDEAVVLGDPYPINGSGDFPYPQIHTLNRAGSLEVIDGIAAVRKR
jgi:hypothetical protein